MLLPGGVITAMGNDYSDIFFVNTGKFEPITVITAGITQCRNYDTKNSSSARSTAILQLRLNQDCKPSYNAPPSLYMGLLDSQSIRP